MNILLCSAGKHGKIIEDLKESLGEKSKVVATSHTNTVPSIYIADNHYVVPDIKEKNYLNVILRICEKENINAITTMLDVETELLAKNRDLFEEIGVEVLVPFLETTKICLDKYLMYKHLIKNNIKTIKTFVSLDSFDRAYQKEDISFPVFTKPRSGRGSVGAKKILNYNELKNVCKDQSGLIIQEFIDGDDIDADVYIDTISKKTVSIFAKKKLQTQIGGASRTVSIKDKKLYSFIEGVVSVMDFNGPVNIDLFYKNGEYYLTEINPRFGATYLHAHGCGVNFVRLINNNLNGIENTANFGDYEEGITMMMYNSAIFVKNNESSNYRGF